MKNIKFYLLGLGILLLTSCMREDDIQPEKTVSSEQLNLSPSALQFTLNGIYADMFAYNLAGDVSHEDFGLRATQVATDLMSNDMYMTKSHWFRHYGAYTAVLAISTRTNAIWTRFYKYAQIADKIIYSVDPNKEETKVMLGQAKAIRALSYFYLVRCYGKPYTIDKTALGVPLYDKANMEDQPRSTVEDIYKNIVKNLEDARVLLANYNDDTHKTIDEKGVQGLSAQVYLSMGDYEKAAKYANLARTGKSLMNKSQWTGYAHSDINNPEVIFGADITSATATSYPSFFSHFDNLSMGYTGAVAVYKAMDKRLYDLIPSTDYRKGEVAGPSGAVRKNVLGADTSYPPYTNFKFKDPSKSFEGDYIYMRSSEMYYIEAEALARLGREAEAKQVLFDITSTKDTTYKMSMNTGSNLIDEILVQKRIEMWGEGCAWFDMKRLGQDLVRIYPGSTIPSFMKINKLSTDNDMLFKIPQKEVDNNPKIKQNP